MWPFKKIQNLDESKSSDFISIDKLFDNIEQSLKDYYAVHNFKDIQILQSKYNNINFPKICSKFHILKKNEILCIITFDIIDNYTTSTNYDFRINCKFNNFQYYYKKYSIYKKFISKYELLKLSKINYLYFDVQKNDILNNIVSRYTSESILKYVNSIISEYTLFLEKEHILKRYIQILESSIDRKQKELKEGFKDFVNLNRIKNILDYQKCPAINKSNAYLLKEKQLAFMFNVTSIDNANLNHICNKIKLHINDDTFNMIYMQTTDQQKILRIFSKYQLEEFKLAYNQSYYFYILENLVFIDDCDIRYDNQSNFHKELKNFKK